MVCLENVGLKFVEFSPPAQQRHQNWLLSHVPGAKISQSLRRDERVFGPETEDCSLLGAFLRRSFTLSMQTPWKAALSGPTQGCSEGEWRVGQLPVSHHGGSPGVLSPSWPRPTASLTWVAALANELTSRVYSGSPPAHSPIGSQ